MDAKKTLTQRVDFRGLDKISNDESVRLNLI